MTLREICESHFERGEDIHFLKIDVEGWERSCIEGMDFNHVRPWILFIESSDPDAKEPAHRKWEKLLIDAGYDFALQYHVNQFYVSVEHIECKDKIIEPAV